MIDRVTLGRDRTGGFNDRDPGQFTIEVALSDNVYANGDDSNDGAEYTQAFDSSAAGFSGVINGPETVQARFTPVLARFVKLTFANIGTDIDEVEIFTSGVPVAVANVAPSVAAANAGVTVDEGDPAANTGTFSDPGLDVVTVTASVGTISQVGTQSGTWSWSFDTSDGPDESQTVTITATDSDNAITTTSFALTVNNVAPTLIISGDPDVDEGSPYTLTVSEITDPGVDTVFLRTVFWGDGNSETFSAAGTLTHTYVDGDSSHAITVELVDEDGIFSDAAAGGALGVVTVLNVPPTVDSISVPPDPVNIADQPVSVSGTFSDPAGTEDEPFTCTVDYDDGTGLQAGTVTGFTCTGPDHTYAGPGVYTVTVTVTDKDGASGSAVATELLVIYDPAGGFATGGGWIIPGGATSDAGDDLPGLDNTSKATFGFVVKYKKGADTPKGQLEFQYRAGNFNLHSTDYDWLVVTNNNFAKFQGLATIKDAEGLFPFKVAARDGDANGGTQSDNFVIKIYDVDADPDTADPRYKASGDLEGGKIIIHSGK